MHSELLLLGASILSEADRTLESAFDFHTREFNPTRKQCGLQSILNELVAQPGIATGIADLFF